jgi:hypothetical protein
LQDCFEKAAVGRWWATHSWTSKNMPVLELIGPYHTKLCFWYHSLPSQPSHFVYRSILYNTSTKIVVVCTGGYAKVNSLFSATIRACKIRLPARMASLAAGGSDPMEALWRCIWTQGCPPPFLTPLSLLFSPADRTWWRGQWRMRWHGAG